VNNPVGNKPRSKRQGQGAKFRRSKALAKRRLLTEIRDFQVARDHPERCSECAANTELQTHAQGESS